MDFINTLQMIRFVQDREDLLNVISEDNQTTGIEQNQQQRTDEPQIRLVQQNIQNSEYNNIYLDNYKSNGYHILNTEGLGGY